MIAVQHITVHFSGSRATPSVQCITEDFYTEDFYYDADSFPDHFAAFEMLGILHPGWVWHAMNTIVA